MNWLTLLLILLPIALLASMRSWFGSGKGIKVKESERQLLLFEQFLSSSFKDRGIPATYSSARYLNYVQTCLSVGITQGQIDSAVETARKEYRDRIVKRQSL